MLRRSGRKSWKCEQDMGPPEVPYRKLLGLNWGSARDLLEKWSRDYNVRLLPGIKSRYDTARDRKVFWIYESESGTGLHVLLASPQREAGEVLHAKNEAVVEDTDC